MPHSSPLHFPDPGAGSSVNPAITLGEKLRLARVAAGYRSQDALAREMQVDRSLVNKAESGRRVPTDPMLRTWCQLCHLDYAPFAAQAHQARTWKNPIPTGFQTFRDFELVAHTVRTWHPIIVPGLLQTSEYAGELCRSVEASDERVEAIVAARMDLQQILNRDDPPTLWCLMYEAVLRCQVGAPEMMYRQLMRLVEESQRRHVLIQIVPSRNGANAGHFGAFTIASVDGEADTLLTDGVEDIPTNNPATVRKAHVIFDRVRSVALPIEGSRDLMREWAEQWNRAASSGVSPASAAWEARTASKLA